MLAAMVAVVACGGKPAPTLQQLQISPVVTEVVENLQASVVATAVYSDGSTQDVTSLVAWSSTDAAVAAAAAGGQVQAGRPGSAYLTAAFGGLQAAARVDVAAATLLSVVVTAESASAPVGLTARLVALGDFSDGTTRDISGSVTWSSTREVVQAQGGGTFKAVSPGWTQVRASIGAFLAGMAFQVTDAQPVTLAVQAADAALPVGTQAAYRVLATFTDGTTRDVTADATVEIADGAVATLLGKDKFKALLVGLTELRAAYLGLTAAAPLQVAPVTLTALQVACPAAKLPPGAMAFFTASGDFSDGSSDDVTARVTWTSSDPLKAVVSNWYRPGAVLPFVPGTITVTALDQATQLTAACTVEIGL
jgi:hypothetical protein